VIGFLDLVYSVYVSVTPDVTVLKTGHIDDRVWYGIGFAFLGCVAVLALRGAARYKKQLETEDNIRLVYNEKRYSACREIELNTETIRVGYRVIGKNSIDNPVVFTAQLVRVDKAGKYTQIPILEIPLSPLVSVHQVHPGRTPMHWVNVFLHGLGSNFISLLYENQPAKAIPLTTGQYELTLVARGASSRGNIGTFTIDMNENNELTLAFKGVDPWSIT